MYPYHNRIKQRIRNGELIGYEFRTDYPGIGECLVLKFNTLPPLRPIRPHRYAEYEDVLWKWQKNKMRELERRILPCACGGGEPVIEGYGGVGAIKCCACGSGVAFIAEANGEPPTGSIQSWNEIFGLHIETEDEDG